MGLDAAFDLEITAVVALALLIVAVAVIPAWEGAGDDAAGNCTGRAAAVRGDVESALGGGKLMTYGQAATKKAWSMALLPTPPEQKDEEEELCAYYLSEYAEADELVRMVPACGHFFHAVCGVDRWLRALTGGRRRCRGCPGRNARRCRHGGRLPSLVSMRPPPLRHQLL